MISKIQHLYPISGIRQKMTGAILAWAVVLLPVAVTTPPVQAQTFSVIHTFINDGLDGEVPSAGLIRDGMGNLYGTASAGGANPCFGDGTCGVVFKLDSAGNETVLHSFRISDGSTPIAGLVRDGVGNLYGAAYFGAIDGGLCVFGCGTIFKLGASGKGTVLHAFTGYPSDGDGPAGDLLRDAAGNLYGTTAYGGENDYGTIFKVDSAGRETVLYSFTGYGNDGARPLSGLVRDKAGTLYGTTYTGGTYGAGTIFKLDTGGTETVLYTFTDGADGQAPYGQLIRDEAGNLYGTAWGGGLAGCAQYGCGTVFKLDVAGNFTVLHTFVGPTEGGSPYGGLLRDAAGNFYGTTEYGGSAACPEYGCGSVYKLDHAGNLTVLHMFTGGADGAQPMSALVRDPAGNLYGTATYGGRNTFCGGFTPGCGVVFKLAP